MNISDSRCTVTKKDVKKLWAGFMKGNMSMTGEITFEEVKLCAPFGLPPFNIVFCLTHALTLSSGCKKNNIFCVFGACFDLSQDYICYELVAGRDYACLEI